MSGLEVIGGISAIISIIDAVTKTWSGARKDLNFGKTWKTVADRLPILQGTLTTCEQNFKYMGATLPDDAVDGLKQVLQSCEARSKKLQIIFEETVGNGDEQWYEKYRKVARRWGKTTKVEELTKLITEDVQQLVNYHAVKTAMTPELNAKLTEIIKAMESAEPSLLDDYSGSQVFNAYESAEQKISTGNSTMYNSENTGSGTVHNVGGITGNPNFVFK